MVVGHKHLQPQSPGVGHAFNAGNAVVYRDQDIGALVKDPLGYRGGQSVSVDHPIGHQITHVFRTQQFQAAYRNRTGRCAVAVVICHDT